MTTLAAVAASALAFALYARVEWPWFALGWVGLVPWLAAVDRSRGAGGALLVGFLMSEAFTLAVFWWFIAAIAGYAGVPWPAGLAVVLLTAPLVQPQFIACALARHLVRRRGAGRARIALIGASAYVGAEWALPKLFADTLGHGFLASASMRQAADLVGAHGLTFALLLANESVLAAAAALSRREEGGGGEAMESARSDRPRPAPAHGRGRRARAPALALLAIIALLAGYGTYRLQQLRQEAAHAPSITAAVVQAGISHYDRLAAEIGTYDAVRFILDTHFGLSAALLAEARPDLIVWPETVYPTTFGAPKSPEGAAFDAEIEAFVRQASVPLIFGTYDSEAGREYNAAVALEPGDPGGAARRAGTYRKARLFPFTERVPAPLDLAPVRRFLPWLGAWQPGRGPRLLDVSLADGSVLRIAPLICYDAVDPGLALDAVRDGAELLVAISNDSWFAHGGGPRLHLVVAAFRSIETRRPQVRATTTGISAVIDATGEVLDSLPVGIRGTLADPVTPRRHGGTLLLTLGDWFGPAALAVAVAGLAGAFRARQTGG